MSRRMVAVCMLSLLLLAVVCAYVFSRIDDLRAASSQSSEFEFIIIDSNARDRDYHAVETEAEADQVLELSVSLPHDEHQSRYYFWKNSSPSMSGISGKYRDHCFAACGEGEDGRGAGLNGSEYITINKQGLFEVSLSYSWRSSKATGEFMETITLPWRGEARLEKHGVKVHAYFRVPVSRQ